MVQGSTKHCISQHSCFCLSLMIEVGWVLILTVKFKAASQANRTSCSLSSTDTDNGSLQRDKTTGAETHDAEQKMQH